MTEQVIDGQFIVEAQLYCSRHHRRLGKVFSEYVSHQLQTSIQFRYTNEQHSLLSPTPRATALCDNDVLLFVRSIVCHLSFFLSFSFGLAHAPFPCKHWGLPHRLAQCATPGLYATTMSFCLSVCWSVICRLWNLWSHSLRGQHLILYFTEVNIKQCHTPEGVSVGCSSPWHRPLSP